MEKFKHKFKLPDKDFKNIECIELDVNPKLKGDSLIFSVTIPKYIYDQVNETSEDFHSEEGRKSKWSFKKKFTNKIQKSSLLEVTKEMEGISQEAMQVQLIKDAIKERVIAVKFTKSDHKERSDWNHAQLGLCLKSSFQYFVCYRKTIRDPFSSTGTNVVYESTERNEYSAYGFKHYHKGEVENNFDIIEWTPEREVFFRHIESQFIKLFDILDKFFGSISEGKIKKLMNTFKGFMLEYKNDDRGTNFTKSSADDFPYQESLTSANIKLNSEGRLNGKRTNKK